MAKRPKKKVLFLVVGYDGERSALTDFFEHAHTPREATRRAAEMARENGVASVTVFRAFLEGKAEPAHVAFTEPYRT